MKHHEEIDKKFLFKENRQLRIELKEVKEMNKLHKDAIYKLSQPHINASQVISVLLELLSHSNKSQKVAKVPCRWRASRRKSCSWRANSWSWIRLWSRPTMTSAKTTIYSSKTSITCARRTSDWKNNCTSSTKK